MKSKFKIETIYDGEEFPKTSDGFDYVILKDSREAKLYRNVGAKWQQCRDRFNTESQAREAIPVWNAKIRCESVTSIIESLRSRLYYELPENLCGSDVSAVVNAMCDFNTPLGQTPRRFSEVIYRSRSIANTPIKSGVSYTDNDKTSGQSWWLLKSTANIQHFLDEHPEVGTGSEHDCSGRYFARSPWVKRAGKNKILVVQQWGTDI